MSTLGLHLVCTFVHQVVFICHAYPVHKKYIWIFDFGVDIGDDEGRSDRDGEGGDGQQLPWESNL